MRNYTVGINVHTADELAAIAPRLRSFIDTIGDGTLDVQLSINPLLTAEVSTNVIGFGDFDAPEDDYDEGEEHE
jgi:hypothetical protein